MPVPTLAFLAGSPPAAIACRHVGLRADHHLVDPHLVIVQGLCLQQTKLIHERRRHVGNFRAVAALRMNRASRIWIIDCDTLLLLSQRETSLASWALAERSQIHQLFQDKHGRESGYRMGHDPASAGWDRNCEITDLAASRRRLRRSCGACSVRLRVTIQLSLKGPARGAAGPNPSDGPRGPCIATLRPAPSSRSTGDPARPPRT